MRITRKIDNDRFTVETEHGTFKIDNDHESWFVTTPNGTIVRHEMYLECRRFINATCKEMETMTRRTPNAFGTLAVLLAHETTTAHGYVSDLYGNSDLAEHCAMTWTCGADLAQWGTFRRGEQITRDLYWTLHSSENTVVTNHPDRSAALVQRFDY